MASILELKQNLQDVQNELKEAERKGVELAQNKTTQLGDLQAASDKIDELQIREALLKQDLERQENEGKPKEPPKELPEPERKKAETPPQKPKDTPPAKPKSGEEELKDALADLKKQDKSSSASSASGRRRSSSASGKGGGSSASRALADLEKLVGQTGVGGGGGQGDGPGGGGIYDVYAGLVMEAIQPNWSMPVFSNSNLTVQVRIKLDRNGNVLDCRIERGSGNNVFDASAVNAVQRTKQLPKPPTPAQQDLLINFNSLDMMGGR